jgi:Family of unknown function (DUF6370)
MRAAWPLMLGLVAILALVVGVQADDKDKEKTLKGTITCAKCDLKVEGQDTCATVVKVTKDGKDTVYYFDTKAHKKYHKDVCKTPKKGTVTGTVSEKDDKKVVTVTKVEYDEKKK